MHSYSIDTTVRQRVHVFLALVAMSIPTFIESARTILTEIGLVQ